MNPAIKQFLEEAEDRASALRSCYSRLEKDDIYSGSNTHISCLFPFMDLRREVYDEKYIQRSSAALKIAVEALEGQCWDSCVNNTCPVCEALSQINQTTK